MPTDDLRIMPVLDFNPSRITVLRGVAAMPMLGNDSLKVALTDQFEEAFTVAIYVVDAQQEVRYRGHDAPQSTLSLNQRECTQVAPVHKQDIERTESWSATAE